MDLFKLSVLIALIIALIILLVFEIVTAAPLARPTATAPAAALPTPVRPAPTAAPSVVPSLTLPAAGATSSDNRVTLAGASLPAGVLTLVGAGAPNVEIEVLDNGKVVGTVRVGADGQWRFTYVPGSGDHELFVRVKEDPGTVSRTFKVTVIASALSFPAGGRCFGPIGRIEGNIYIVGVCDTLTQIGRITGISVKALSAANPQITDTNRIYVGQAVWLPR